MTPGLVDAQLGVLPFQFFPNGMQMPPKDPGPPELRREKAMVYERGNRITAEFSLGGFTSFQSHGHLHARRAVSLPAKTSGRT
jgi:hypothetical protein